MIRLGLRLLLGGGRHTAMVVALSVLGVAAGAVALLLALSVPAAMQARADRTAWRSGGDSESLSPPSSRDPYTAVVVMDQFSSHGPVVTVWSAPSDARAPTFPGLARNPRPGESFVSPALRSLLPTSPELAARYGPITGVVGKQALAGPDTLMVIRYLPESRMDPAQRERVTRFSTHGQSMRFEPILLRLLVPVGVVVTLTPLIVFVAAVTRWSSVGRERRLSALRLAGATRSQVGFIAAVEALLLGVAGACLGLVSFFAVRPLAAHVSDTGERWFVADLNPGPGGDAAAIIGIPLLVAISTQLALSRVNTSPLGTARRTGPWRLRAWRITPLLACLIGGACLLMTGRTSSFSGTEAVMGFVLIASLSVLTAGPYLTLFLGRVLAAGTGSRLLAGARMVDDPRAAFRAVASVMFAVFAGTVFTATTPAAVASAQPGNRFSGLNAGVATISSDTAPLPTNLIHELRRLPGVSLVTPVYEGRVAEASDPNDSTAWITDCVTATRLIQIHVRSCVGGSILVNDKAKALPGRIDSLRLENLAPAQSDPQGAAAPMSAITVRIPGLDAMTAPPAYDTPAFLIPLELIGPQRLARIRPNRLLMRYESLVALEHARTVVDQTAPGRQLLSGPETVTANTEGARHIRTALLVATFAVFSLAGAGLAVSTSIGLLQRRRQYALLRMTGVTVATIRRAMLWETAMPLAVACLLATALGLLIASALLGAGGMTLPLMWALAWPPIGGYVLALASTTCAFPIIRRVTDTEEVRLGTS